MAAYNSRPPLNPHAETASVVGDRYRVIEVLGRGGMGVVYRVHDPSSGRQLALKQALQHLSKAETSQSVAALEREFHLLAQLAHPGLVEVYDYGIDHTGPFYTMELLDYGDVKALAPLAVPRACALALDVCSSLALLHARRLVHRDISPRNVRCTHDGHAKLIDFGAVVPMGPCTHTVGTPSFVAPEVVHHSSLDARTDLFSLGATLYFALTGRQPFNARNFSQLRDAWAQELVPPSRLVPGIPAALDALCVALLRIDPAERPRSVYEVIQRLQAIGGVAQHEPENVSQAYLVTPALIGREPLLRRFRQRTRGALHGQGSAVRFESAAGVGRTRLLDACVLEAKTLGAIVVRATASAGTTRRFGAAQQLLEQLLQALPEVTDVVAGALRVRELLFEVVHTGRRARSVVRSLADPSLDRAQVQTAIERLFVQICDSHALMIAVDDVHAVDEVSLGLLASLVLQSKQQRLLVALTCDEIVHEQPPAAFAVLSRQCSRDTLAPLTREETRALLASVFGNSVYLQALADRLYEVSLGVARETLALTQHLVDHGAIRYRDGQWTLPRELDASQLPARAVDVFAERIANLAPLARRIAEAQALLGNVLRHEDYALLAPEVSAAERDQAVLSLQTCGIVQYDGEFYNLRDRTLAQLLCERLDPAQKRARHLTVLALYRAQPDVHPYLFVHHLLEAGEHAQALDLLAKSDEGDERNIEAALKAGPKRLAMILERALELSQQVERPAREAHELRRKICGLSMMAADENWYERIAPTWLAQLERDSGLADYRALDAALDPAARLQTALQRAAARHLASPERERVYRVDEAIKNLGLYVQCSLSLMMRSNDPRAAAPLPGLLEPFTALSPALFALWQASNSVCALFGGRMQDARRAWLEVDVRLAAVPDDALRFLSGLRLTAASALALYEAYFGRAQALEWVEKLDAVATLQIDALHTRALAYLMLGDTERAEHCTQQAQLRALTSSALRIVNPGWSHELHASVYLRDLAGLRRVIDGVAPNARVRPGWRPQLNVAVGHFELLRGDLNAAEAAFAQARALAFPEHEAQPLWVNDFAYASSGLVAVATERNDFVQAIALGEQALQRCQALRADLASFAIATALALAFAAQRDFVRAAAHSDAVIAAQQQLGAGGIVLANSYAVRASIAVLANDASAAEQYIAQTLAQAGGHRVLAAAAQRTPLLLRARPNDPARADTHASTEKSRADNPEAARVRQALSTCDDKASRAARALELLCTLTRAETGHLYLVSDDQSLMYVATRNGKPPDADAQRFANGFFAQQLDDECLSAFTQTTHMVSLPGAANYIDPSGHEHQLLTLTCKDSKGLAYVGLAVLASVPVQPSQGSAAQLLTQLAVLAALLLDAGDSPGSRPLELSAREAP